MNSVWHAIRLAIGGLQRSPGATAAAVVTLTLVIGLTAAVFSVVYESDLFVLTLALAVSVSSGLGIGLVSATSRSDTAYWTHGRPVLRAAFVAGRSPSNLLVVIQIVSLTALQRSCVRASKRMLAH
jgi:hypothetical protein